MAEFIALLITLGIITTPEEATPDILEQNAGILSTDVDSW